MLTMIYSTFVLFMAMLFASVALSVQSNDAISYQVGSRISYLSTQPLFFTGQAQRPIQFTQSSSFGIGIGTGYSTALTPTISWTSDIMLQYEQGRFTEFQPTTFIINGIPTAGTIEHVLSLQQLSFGLHSGMGYFFSDQLYVSAGLAMWISPFSKFTQTERITSPSDGRFISGENEQELATGAAFGFTAMGGGFVSSGYTVLDNQSIRLTPYIRMSYLPYSTNTDITSALAVEAGVQLGFKTSSNSAPISQPDTLRLQTPIVASTVNAVNYIPDTLLTTPVQSDTTPVPKHITQQQELPDSIPSELKPLLGASVKLSFVNEKGKESEKAGITITEFISQRYEPLLPYIFFDSLATELPERYRSKGIYPQLAHYYALADTIVERLRQSPPVTIELKGFATLAEGGATVALQRAEAVKQWLIKAGLPQQHTLSVSTGGELPTIPSTSLDSLGRAENRRVEISTLSEGLLSPVLIKDTLLLADPPTIRFRPAVFSEVGISFWRLLVVQQGQTIAQFTGEGAPPEKIDWNIAQSSVQRPRADVPLHYIFTIRDAEQQQYSTDTATLEFAAPLRKRNNATLALVEQFSVLLFDYNTGSLSQSRKYEAFFQQLRRRIANRNDIRIIGSTDVLGTPEYNLKLSTERAAEVAKLLKIPLQKAVGIGIDTSSYPNSVPEGRFYSRTVKIIIGDPFK